MSRKPESEFRSALSASMRKAGFFVQALESGSTGSGIPDLYYSFDEETRGFMELKVIRADWPCDRKVPFRPGQAAWLRNDFDHGGQDLVAIKYDNGVLITHILFVDRTTHRPARDRGLFFPAMKDIGDSLRKGTSEGSFNPSAW